MWLSPARPNPFGTIMLIGLVAAIVVATIVIRVPLPTGTKLVGAEQVGEEVLVHVEPIAPAPYPPPGPGDKCDEKIRGNLSVDGLIRLVSDQGYTLLKITSQRFTTLIRVVGDVVMVAQITKSGAITVATFGSKAEFFNALFDAHSSWVPGKVEDLLTPRGSGDTAVPTESFASMDELKSKRLGWDGTCP